MIFFIDEEAFREGKVMIWLNCFYFFIFFASIILSARETRKIFAVLRIQLAIKIVRYKRGYIWRGINQTLFITFWFKSA